MQKLRDIEQALDTAPEGQVSLTDPDSRSMATSGKGSGIVGYNMQAAVEAGHHLIVALRKSPTSVMTVPSSPTWQQPPRPRCRPMS